MSAQSVNTESGNRGVRWDFVEDVSGRVLLILWFVYACTAQLYSAIWQINSAQVDPLRLIQTFLMVSFSGLIIALTMTRRSPLATAPGWLPRVVAFLGTFLIVGMPVLPPGHVSPFWSTVSILLMIAGLIASLYSLAWLGRSFSIMPTARKLVTGGPYGVVRHPLYACELLTVLGAVIGNFSLVAIAFGVATMLLLGARAVFEERVLSATFPEYAEYAKRVPRFVPRLLWRPKA
ncbi:MAG: methyltransferase family protein [Devosia sp.]